MKLRNYQERAVEAIIASWKKCRSCLIVLPTGCGKTVVFGEVIRRLIASKFYLGETEPRAMVLAHRTELIDQAKDKIQSMSGCSDVGVEMGDREATQMFGEWPRVIVSSVQTQISLLRQGYGVEPRLRMKKFNPFDFNALVIDEAHHATSKSYRQCIEHYFRNGDCRLLGVTATPDRADETALGTVFDTVAFEYSVTDAIHDGWLVPVRQKLVEVTSLDYSKVSTTAGDFNQGELSEVLEQEKNLYGIASPTVEICKNRRAIVFATSVKQAERLAEIINRFRPDKAGWVCGKTPKVDREDILSRFRRGELQFIVNVGVLTEGFDDAGVEVVVMARPTKSRALYAQMAGRATRPAAEIAGRLGEAEVQCAARRAMIAASSKPSCLIVDFVGNSGRHKLVTMLDILGGKEYDPDDEEVQKLIKKRCTESEDGEDTLEELEKTREEIKERKLEDARQRKFILVTAKYAEKIVDPFDLYDLAPMDRATRSALDARRLSFKQCQILRERVGVDPTRLSPADGKALLDEYFGRIKYGLATLKQTKFLRKKGIQAPMSFQEANWTITKIMQGREAV